MAEIYKVTILFDDEPYGWSDSWYKSADTIESVLPLAATLAKFRMRLAPADVNWLGLRVSNALKFRDSLFRTPQALGLAANGTYPAAVAAESPVALVCRIEATALHRRGFSMRGIPEAIVSPDNIYNPINTFRTRVQNFETILLGGVVFGQTAGRWSLLEADATQPSIPFNPVKADFAQTTPIVTTLGVPQVNGPPLRDLAPGDQVRLSRVRPRGSRAVAGIHTVLSIVVNPLDAFKRDITMLPSPRPIALSPASTCTLQPLVYGLGDITSFIDEKLRSRKTGRPSGGPVGRRKAP